jgi:hypothetical protein
MIMKPFVWMLLSLEISHGFSITDAVMPTLFTIMSTLKDALHNCTTYFLTQTFGCTHLGLMEQSSLLCLDPFSVNIS